MATAHEMALVEELGPGDSILTNTGEVVEVTGLSVDGNSVSVTTYLGTIRVPKGIEVRWVTE